LSRPRRAIEQIWPRVAVVALIVAVWALVSATGYWERVLLPSPASVWHALISKLGGQGGLLVAAYHSLFRLFLGLVAGILIGTPTGLAMASSKHVQRSVGSLMVGLNALPSISWLPLAVVWFGFTEKAVWFVVVMGAIPAIAIATAAAVRLVPPTLVRAARTMGASGARLYGQIVLPAAVPGYLAGLQQAWAIAWRALMAAELFTTGARGLGHLIARSGAQLDTPLVLAAIVVIMLVGVGVDFLLATLDRRVRRRRGLVAGG
jgi:NitT/TauT family transport system permease protein